MKSTRPSQTVAAFDVLTSGREFYDDGYTEEEQNTVDLPSTYQPNSANLRSSIRGTDGDGAPSGTSNNHAAKLHHQHDSSLSARTSINNASVAATEPAEGTTDRPFFGRTAELRKLKSIQTTIIKSNGSQQKNGDGHQQRPPIYPAVLVWGTSGTGKSCMVEQFINDACCSCSYVLRGKYDEGTGGSEPFSGIIQALDDLATQLKHGPPEELDRMRSLIGTEFSGRQTGTNGTRYGDSNDGTKPDNITHPGNHTHANSGDSVNTNRSSSGRGTGFRLELSGLTALVPSLSILLTDGNATTTTPSVISQSIIPSPSDDQASVVSRSMSISPSVMSSTQRSIAHGQSSAGSSQNAWNRLQYIFIQFMKAISTPTKPVYLFLDDLQWSSSAGLELLATLIADPDLDSFMLLGAIRQDTDPHNNEVIQLEADAALRTSFLDRLVSHDDAVDKDTVGGHGNDGRPSEAGRIVSDQNQQNQGQEQSQEQSQQRPQQRPHLEQITIANLSLGDTAHWLSDMFDRPQDDPDLLVLTKKLYKKTHGNVFFTLQAIEELKRKNIIVFSRITFMWEWNLPTKNKNRNVNTNTRVGFGTISAFGDGQDDGGDGDGDDDDDDDDDLPISDNIVAAIESQLRQLSDDVQHVLSIASYIRARFDLSTLHKVLDRERAHASSSVSASAWTQSKVMSILQQAITERLIIKSTTAKHRYQFAHDRIQQAAYGLIPYGEVRDKLRVRIGHCLLDLYTQAQEIDHTGLGIDHQDAHQGDHQGSPEGGKANVEPLQMEDPQDYSKIDYSTQYHPHSPQQDDTLLFVAADHLNSVQTKDHMFSVAMNLRVGEKALQMAALASAASYLHKASNSLKRVRNPWDEHYNVALRLCQARAEVELSLGHFEVGYKLGNEVIDRAVTLDETLQTYLLMARSLGRENKHAESLSMSLTVARMSGVIPRRFYVAHILRDMWKIKSYLKRHTDAEILGLPLMDNYRMEMATCLTYEFGLRSFLTGAISQWILHVAKNIKLTLRHGICEGSATAFAALGQFYDNATTEYALGARCANIALQILEKTNGNYYAGSVQAMVTMYSYHYRLPTEDLIKNFDKGYRVSMSAGDFETGMAHLQGRCFALYHDGYELHSLADAVQSILNHFRVYRVVSVRGMADSFFLLTQYLTGTVPIDWEALEQQSWRDLKTDMPEPSEIYEVKPFYFTSASIATYFRKFNLAHRLTRLFQKIGPKSELFILSSMGRLLLGITSAAMYRQTKKAKYRRAVSKQVAAFRSIIDNMGDTLLTMTLLLEAEHMSLAEQGKTFKPVIAVKDAYDKAIRYAQDSGNKHFVALGCELAAEYLHATKEQLLNQSNSKFEVSIPTAHVLSSDTVSDYMTKAVRHYDEWGCQPKVKDMQDRRSQYLKEFVPNSKRR